METKRKTRVGRVISDKMDKTVIVAVETPKQHPAVSARPSARW